MLAGSHRNAWPDETGTGGRTNRNTHQETIVTFGCQWGTGERLQDKRSALLGICRYLYLDGRFDDKLWDALLTQMKHPTESRFITSDIDEADLYIL